MHVVIVRHAEPLPADADPTQPLSPKGHRQAADVGRQLQALGIAVDRIQHSPKARARETAQDLAQAMGAGAAPQERSGIKPMDPVEPLVREILDAEAPLMLVSHLPLVGLLTAVLMDHAEGTLPVFTPGCCAVVRRDDESGKWTLAHFLRPAE